MYAVDFELVQVHEGNGFAEVVIRDKNGLLVYAGNLQKMPNPGAYYPPVEGVGTSPEQTPTEVKP